MYLDFSSIHMNTIISSPLDFQAAPATVDDDDLDLFGDETEEEKKAAEEREAAVKASSKKKESELHSFCCCNQ